MVEFVAMPGSDRSGIGKTLVNNWRPLCVIAVGLVFTVYLAWRLQPEKPDLPRYEPTKSQASSYQAGGRDCSPTALAAIRDIGKRSAKSDDCADKANSICLTVKVRPAARTKNETIMEK